MNIWKQLRLRNACYYGHVNEVKEIITDTAVDPGIDDSLTIQGAIRRGHVEVVKELVKWI